jgi:hypothetical protein
LATIQYEGQPQYNNMNPHDILLYSNICRLDHMRCDWLDSRGPWHPATSRSSSLSRTLSAIILSSNLRLLKNPKILIYHNQPTSKIHFTTKFTPTILKLLD